MKNILSLILATVLLLLTTVPAFAAELSGTGSEEGFEVSDNVDISHTVGNNLTGNGSVDSDVSHTVQGGYVIVIPEAVIFTASTTVCTSQVGVGDVRVPGTLHFSVSSSNYDETKGWVLTSVRGDTLKYTIKADDTPVEENGGDLLSCAHGTTYLKKELTFELVETEAKDVSYTDRLTFQVYVD